MDMEATQIECDEQGAARLLRGYSLELTPGEEAHFEPPKTHFPVGSRVFVTHLQGRTPSALAGAAAQIKKLGWIPVAHLAARNFGSEAEFVDTLETCRRVGVSEALLIGGAEAGVERPFFSAIDLLRHPALAAADLRVAWFAGHPEGHPEVSDVLLQSCLVEKLSEAARLGLDARIVTQFGFDGAAVARWIKSLRDSGVACPVAVGMAGVTSFAKLLRFAALCGVGASVTMLRSRGINALMSVVEMTPKNVLEALADELGALRVSNVGIHFFPFGGLDKTVTWIAQYRGQAGHGHES